MSTSTAEPVDQRRQVTEALAKIDRWIWSLARAWGPRVRVSAEDFRAELLIRIWAAYATFHPEKGSLTTWASYQARHVATIYNRARVRNREFTVSQDDALTLIIENAPAATAGTVEPIGTDTLDRALDKLPVRHARAIRLRFGLAEGEGRTLEQVGQEMGFTQERARQVVGRGLERLRKEMAGA